MNNLESPILQLLKSIEEKHFGPVDDLDAVVRDEDLLNGFMEGYVADEDDLPTNFGDTGTINQTLNESKVEEEEGRCAKHLKSTWFYYALLTLLFIAVILEIFKTLSYGWSW